LGPRRAGVPVRRLRHAGPPREAPRTRSARPGRAAHTTKSWWDTVDVLASRVVGPVAERPIIESWLTSGDLWLERTAILHQLGYGERTDADFLFRSCLTHAASTEFFLRKAIGWALRQYARVDPAAVRGFVAAHADELSGLSRREALKHL
jgi:3-methyladenine DNA glycosylase AlkD